MYNENINKHIPAAREMLNSFLYTIYLLLNFIIL